MVSVESAGNGIGTGTATMGRSALAIPNAIAIATLYFCDHCNSNHHCTILLSGRESLMTLPLVYWLDEGIPPL